MQKTLRNSVISVFAEIILLLLQFVNRKIFVIFLNVELLGYQSLFDNIFSLLSVAELGIGGIISFRLYKEIVEQNIEEIQILMAIYKWVYRVIAFVVFIVGLIMIPILPYIAKDSTISWSYMLIIYSMQLGNVVCGYLLSYKRTIFIVNQKEYKCIQINMYVSILLQCLQLLLLWRFRNYFLYLGIQLIIPIVSNIIISYKANCEYSYLKKRTKVSLYDIKRRGILKDAKEYLVNMLANAVFGGTDSIIISSLCGIREVALYGNYMILQKGVMQIVFYKLLNPVRATLGNIIYSGRKKEDLWEQFETLDVFSFFMASYIGIGFLVFTQPVIQLWIGEQYLLSFSFVALFSINIYVGALWEIVYKYRCVFGDYRQDWKYMLLSAVANLIISIVGAIKYGVAGVLIGTIIGFLFIAYGRIRYVVKIFFGKSVFKYLRKHIILFCLVLLEGTVCTYLTNKMPVSILGILQRLVVYLGIITLTSGTVFYKNKYFRKMFVYIIQIKNIILNKIKKGRKKE